MVRQYAVQSSDRAVCYSWLLGTSVRPMFSQCGRLWVRSFQMAESGVFMPSMVVRCA